MTLTERIAERRCRVVDCQRERARDAAVCADHMRDLWMNRLDRNPDGSYCPRRSFTARDLTWRTAA